jgi:hypothetical protein
VPGAKAAGCLGQGRRRPSELSDDIQPRSSRILCVTTKSQADIVTYAADRMAELESVSATEKFPEQSTMENHEILERKSRRRQRNRTQIQMQPPQQADSAATANAALTRR